MTGFYPYPEHTSAKADSSLPTERRTSLQAVICIPLYIRSLPLVDTSKLPPAEAEAVRADFWELIEWWRERKLQRVYESTPRETARQTYHVEKRFIRPIHQEAEAEGVSITEVVNRAFRGYFDITTVEDII
jgi:hypothetical protein